MNRARWILLSVASVPILAGALIVSAGLGPLGAAIYCVVLLGGVNTRHFLRDHHDDDFVHRLLHRKGRHR